MYFMVSITTFKISWEMFNKVDIASCRNNKRKSKAITWLLFSWRKKGGYFPRFMLFPSTKML